MTRVSNSVFKLCTVEVKTSLVLVPQRLCVHWPRWWRKTCVANEPVENPFQIAQHVLQRLGPVLVLIET
jgi:hypothetical protein